MRQCISCDGVYPSSKQDCPSCGFIPDVVDGFDAYAPELAHIGSGFKADYFAELVRLEETNFWFQSRNKLLVWALENYSPNFQSMLEIGCGTGFVLSGIARQFPGAELYGSEIFVAGLDLAAARLPDVEFMQMDARNIPFADEFDVIGAFDVLEHIKQDEVVLSEMYAALKPGGAIILSVPQHAWLWSATDEYALHERRYSAKDLHRKVEAAGFRIVRSTSFVTTLLPAMTVSRFLNKKKPDEQFDATAELSISPWLNTIFSRMLDVEISLIRRGINFPVGGSRVVVARKP